MEDNIQTLFIYLISIILLFIFPVYVAYEKKDDISYALALKYTQEFTNEVSKKGYLSNQDYYNFVSRLSSTGNMYDIKLEHEYSSVLPAVNYYDAYGELKKRVSREYYNSDPEKILYNTVLAYRNAKEVFEEEHILNIINQIQGVDINGNNIYFDYYMNEGDTFKVIVKNTNSTLATTMYNMIVPMSENTRIYINCSENIVNTKWYAKEPTYNVTDVWEDPTTGIKYVGNSANGKTLLYDDAPIENLENTALGSNTSFSLSNVYKNFNIDFVLFPLQGIDIYSIGTKYNSATLSNYIIDCNADSTSNGIAISAGVNGITVEFKYWDYGQKRMSVLTYKGLVNKSTNIEISVKNEEFALFVNGEQVSYSKLSDLVSNPTIINRGISINNNHFFVGGTGKFQDDSETYLKIKAAIE